MNYQTILIIGFAFLIGYFFITLFLVGEKKQTLSEHFEEKPQRWFSILRIHQDATEDEIKSAYLNKIKEYHPDKVASLGIELQKLAEEKTKEINHAYEEALQELAHRH